MLASDRRYKILAGTSFNTCSNSCGAPCFKPPKNGWARAPRPHLFHPCVLIVCMNCSHNKAHLDGMVKVKNTSNTANDCLKSVSVLRKHNISMRKFVHMSHCLGILRSIDISSTQNFFYTMYVKSMCISRPI